MNRAKSLIEIHFSEFLSKRGGAKANQRKVKTSLCERTRFHRNRIERVRLELSFRFVTFLALASLARISAGGCKTPIALDDSRKAAFEAMTDEQLPVCFKIIKLVEELGIGNLHNHVNYQLASGAASLKARPARAHAQTEFFVGRASEMEEVVNIGAFEHMPISRRG